MNKLASLQLVTLLIFTSIGVAAPPNPYLFGTHDPITGKWKFTSKNDKLKFQNALENSCTTRKITNRQTLTDDGIEHLLAIKIDFSDQPGQRSSQQINSYLFADEGVSLRTYYREVSYGKMLIDPGENGGVVPIGDKWVRAKKNMGYYGSGKINVDRYRELVREACAGVDEFVNFKSYDRNGDKIVDHLFLIHAGDDEASTFSGSYGDNIWSIFVSEINRRFDGILVKSAVVVAEEPSFDRPHLGIYFHEFFHDLGAPDLYGSQGIDDRDHKWGLMGMFGPYQGELVDGIGDGSNPSHITGYLKWDFDARPGNGTIGWIEPIEILETLVGVKIPNIELNDKMFKIDIPGKKEFFLLENRHRESGAIFDRKIPESGILIWHVDETKIRSRYEVDAGKQFWLEDPNDAKHIGINPENRSETDRHFISDGAAYSADDGETEFTPNSEPDSNANDGTHSGISITDISNEGEIMSFNVWFSDTYEPNDNFSEAFPIDFNKSYESFIFSDTDRRDLYKVEAFSGSAIVVELSNLPMDTDYRLSLYDENRRLIAEGYRSDRSSQVVHSSEENGVVYISVKSEEGFSDLEPYRLSVHSELSTTLRLTEIKVFPNPAYFGARVNFSYAIPDRYADLVELQIFDVLGNLIHVDRRENLGGANKFSWQNAQVSSGVYFYFLSARRDGEFVSDSGKFVFVR